MVSEHKIDISGIKLGEREIEFINKINKKPFFATDLFDNITSVRDTYMRLRTKDIPVCVFRDIRRKKKKKFFTIYYIRGQEEEVIKMAHIVIGISNNLEKIYKIIYSLNYDSGYKNKKYREKYKEDTKQYRKDKNKKYREKHKEYYKERNKKLREIKKKDKEEEKIKRIFEEYVFEEECVYVK